MLVEQHRLRGKQKEEADAICFASKNLYNLALYNIRQFFFENHLYLTYLQLDKMLQQTEAYKSLPAKVSQQVLQQVDRGFRSFFQALEIWERDPSSFRGKPKIPKYLDKQYGRNMVIYTTQAISKIILNKNSKIHPSKTNIFVTTKIEHNKICMVRLIPKNTGEITLEVIYNKEPLDLRLNSKNKLAIDLGVNNLCAITSDNPGFQPILVKGGTSKAINQWYNKEKAEKQSKLAEGRYASKSIHRLTEKRNLKMKHMFHCVSKFIIEICKENNIGTIVIGQNKEWKQSINIGKRNNQNFVSIPYNTLINMIEYKAYQIGINVIKINESYTSKCSAIDLEPIHKHEKYMGKRIKRGLFQSANGIELNADVNGSMNILRKAFPEAFVEGIEAVVVQPLPVKFTA